MVPNVKIGVIDLIGQEEDEDSNQTGHFSTRTLFVGGMVATALFLSIVMLTVALAVRTRKRNKRSRREVPGGYASPYFLHCLGLYDELYNIFWLVKKRSTSQDFKQIRIRNTFGIWIRLALMLLNYWIIILIYQGQMSCTTCTIVFAVKPSHLLDRTNHKCEETA